jgi:TPR repeat protein
MTLRLYLRAAELGNLASIVVLAGRFRGGDVVPQDAAVAMKLATIAAKKGDLESYHLLGHIYDELGDVENATKSYIFAARAGNHETIEFLRTYKTDGAKVVSDDDLEAIEEAYKDAVQLEWSEEREAFKKHPVYCG